MQFHKTYFVISLALVILGGCNQVLSGASETKALPGAAGESAQKREQGAEKNSQPQPIQPESHAFESKLKKGMSYAELRNIVVASGWNPVVDLECKANVVGADFKEICKSNPGLESCGICDHLPELSSCSGDAYCGMFFSNGSEKLHVVTFGDFSDWDVAGGESQLSVESWDLSKN